MQRNSYYHMKGQVAIAFYGWTKPLICSVKTFLAYLQYICEGEEMPSGRLVHL